MDAMPDGLRGQGQRPHDHELSTSGFLVGPPLGGLVIDWLELAVGLLPARALWGSPASCSPRCARVGVQAVTAPRPAAHRLRRAPRSSSSITVALTLLLDRRRRRDLVGAGRTSAMAARSGRRRRWDSSIQEWRASDPIVNFALFRIRMFTASVVSLLVLGTANSVLGILAALLHAERARPLALVHGPRLPGRARRPPSCCAEPERRAHRPAGSATTDLHRDRADPGCLRRGVPAAGRLAVAAARRWP